MTAHRSTAGTALLAGLCLFLGTVCAALQEAPIANPPSTRQAAGPFDVQLAPQAPAAGESAVPGRMLLDKQFHGDLEATSKGQMLAATTSVQGSAGYVAMEQVTGSLHGRTGTFVLQHSGTMTRGTPSLTITVVPDSGTGQLEGLAGTMRIDIAPGGKHSYTFEYTLPATP